MKNDKIEHLKKQLITQLKTQGFTDIALCKELIVLSKRERDSGSIALGHIWMAETFLNEENKIDCGRELEIAKSYLDENYPSEILEKYYFIEYKLHNALYDTQTAFYYCLKSLNISEQLHENPELIDKNNSCFINTVGNRVVGNLGNIGINFFNQGIYEKALHYCTMALDILKRFDDMNVYAECLLRLNIVISSLRTDNTQDVLHNIHLIESLPIDKESLKIYVDYAYVNYFIYICDMEQIEFYVNELLNDQIEKYTDRLTAIDFFIDILSPLIKLKMGVQAKLLFKEVHQLIHDNEVRPLLSLTKLKIIYANAFEKKDQEMLYKEYFQLYVKNEKLTNTVKTSGLDARLKLTEIELENKKARSQLRVLEDIANYDQLTKIFNRRYLEIKYNELLNARVDIVGLAIIDIDYFKEYNDIYGHLAGDEIIKIVATCLTDALLNDMMACRYGGDEFVVLSWSGDVSTLYSYAQAVKKALCNMKIEHKRSRCSDRVTISVGIRSKKISTNEDTNVLFNEADKALYIAKDRGRNQICKM